MTKPKRPQGSIENIFNRILLGSFLIHLAFGFLIMNVEPPPPPTQEEYATFLKKLAPPKPLEEKPPEVVPEKEKEEVKKEEEKPSEEEAAARVPTKAAPARARAQAPGETARRAEVRKKLSGAGLLATIGAVSEEGGLANVFESEAVVSKDLGSVLSERGGVRVTGGTRIGKKGALGAGTSADIGEVEVGAGGSAGEVGGKKSLGPKAFVKGGEEVIKKGGIDEKGVRLALRRREPGIRQCYERALKSNANLKGRVVLEWTINEQGKVVKVLVIENTLGDPKVVECITDIIMKVRFPPAKEGLVPVRKTFVFESG